MWQFQPVSNPIFSANTYRQTTLRGDKIENPKYIMSSWNWFSHQCHTLLRSSSSMEKYTKRIQAPTRFSMSRTVSSRAWNWDDTIPMKIWPLRAWTQSSFSKPSPIPSGIYTVHIYVRVGQFALCKFDLSIYLSIDRLINGSIARQTIISKYIYFLYIFSLYCPDRELNRPCLSPSELQLFLRLPCLMGVVLGSSTPEKSVGPGASSTHFPFSWSDNATCIGL